ncbi:MAG: sigma-70 family RNA polymerase sigma factor [Bacteroidota bacterium]
MIKAKQASDQRLLEGILQADRQSLLALYDQYFPEVLAYVRKNNGQAADAEDLFQEIIMVLFRKVQSGNLTLSTSLGGYVFSIGRNLWLKQLRDKKELSGGEMSLEADAEMEALVERELREKIFFENLEQLGEKCRQILQWFFAKVSMREIAGRLGSTEAYIKKRKFVCKQKLIEAIEQDPRFKSVAPDSDPRA